MHVMPEHIARARIHDLLHAADSYRTARTARTARPSQRPATKHKRPRSGVLAWLRRGQIGRLAAPEEWAFEAPAWRFTSRP
jgi:hypothetical protein